MPVKKKAPARKKKTTTRRKKSAPKKKKTGGALSSGGKTRYRARTKRGGKASWSSVAPKTTAERRKIKKKCGDGCFGDPATLGYPICTSRSCEPDPRGIEAARSRAKQFDQRKGAVGKRARAVLRKIGK